MAQIGGQVAGTTGGLLDVVVDPDFASNQLVYLSYTEAAPERPADAKDEGDPRLGPYQDLNDVVLKGLAVARGRLDGDHLKDVQVIWRQTPKTIGRGHFGGQLVFASDGKLFITSGDRQRFDPAQDLGSTLGKIVRINPDGSTPLDNPFVNQDDALSEIWSFGHSNPLGAAVDPASGKLWAHEMGPKGGDEATRLSPQTGSVGADAAPTLEPSHCMLDDDLNARLNAVRRRTARLGRPRPRQ